MLIGKAHPFMRGVISVPQRGAEDMAGVERGTKDMPQARRARRQVLVVSEDNQFVNFVGRYFREKAFEVADSRNPAVIPIDVLNRVELVVFDITVRNDRLVMANLAKLVHVPILAVSAAISSEAIADLLRAGADTVIRKPFTLDALDAHLETLRRLVTGTSRPLERFVYQDLVLDLQAHVVTVAGRRTHLTAIQYRILEFLCLHAGAIVTLSQLSDAVWGPGFDASGTLIRSHIRNIRRRLGDSAAHPRFVRTEKQIGYWMPRGDDTAS